MATKGKKSKAAGEARQHPPLLYHYTDFNGLKGILESNSLRATYTGMMNDFSEHHYGLRLMRLRTRAILGKSHPFVSLVNFWTPQIPRRAFASCFCESPNVLPMWREYANHGEGYCLGFSTTDLFRICDPITADLLTKINYGAISDSLEELLVSIRDGSLGEDKATFQAGALSYLTHFIKHKSFVDEQEWRLVTWDPPIDRVMFNSGAGTIKPYIELKIQYGDERLPLERVICGPTLHNNETTLALEWMLRKYGHERVSVTASDIPLRSGR